MKLLCVETSGDVLSLAVSDGERILATTDKLVKQGMSSSVMPGINAVLKVSKIPLKAIDVFCVGLGPGSFTGLRVGMATVKALAFATRKPVMGISSLDLLAQSVCENMQQISVIVDARRQLVYAARYISQPHLKRQGEYILTDIRRVLDGFQGNVLFQGNAIALYKDDIRRHEGLVPSFSPKKSWKPQAKWMPVLLKERISKKQFDDIDGLAPLYLYPEYCQVRR